MLSGLGFRFIRDLEQGEATVRMDKVSGALHMFGMEAGLIRKANAAMENSESDHRR